MDYYDGTIDGLAGPATKRAMASYARDHRVENSFVGIATGLINSGIRREWLLLPIERMKPSIDAVLESYLLDYQSARVDQIEVLMGPKNGLAACVRLNAKNAVGAYTGYQTLYLVGVPLPFQKPYFLEPSDVSSEVAETWCALGYVLEAE